MRTANLRSSLLALMLVAAGAAAGLRICGKSGPSRSEVEVYPSLEDTLCEVIAKAPPARAQGPLPDDAALAAWTEQVEGALAEGLALVAMEDAHTYWHSAPTERDVACARKLWTAASRLPPEYRLRRLAEESLERLLRKDAGSPERTKLAQVLALTVDASSSPAPSSA